MVPTLDLVGDRGLQLARATTAVTLPVEGSMAIEVTVVPQGEERYRGLWEAQTIS